MQVSQILNQIDSGDIALPEFQRGYVWNREQVRSLFTSLYRQYPVGGFMTWNTAADSATARGGVSTDGTVKLLLDGQQRGTSLYGVIRGRAPKFFEGNAQAFTGLYFNVQDEVFEFCAPGKMKNDPAWIDVSALFAAGHTAIGTLYPSLLQLAGGDNGAAGELVGRVTRVAGIADRDFHIEEVTGPDESIDVVVDIFNRVNSGGTKLSKGDLALAKVCASWPEARQQFNDALTEWRNVGFDFKLDWLLRVVNAIATGKAPFTALAGVSVADVQTSLKLARRYVSAWLDVIGGRLGLDHDRVLFSKFALVILARHTHGNGGRLPDAATQGKLLAWFAHTGMWGRYAGSTETFLSQDLDAVDAGGADALLETIRQSRGDLTVRETDFAGSTMGSRFYPTLYMLTRTQSARDFGTGLPLSASLLGHLSSLDVHHIFPKALLYKEGYRRGDVNAVANFCFLTKQTNITISATPPSTYMPKVEAAQPGALASQWISTDPAMWETSRFHDFLADRRRSLAAAANAFLEGLEKGTTAQAELQPSAPVDVPEEERDEATEEVDTLVSWLVDGGYATPQRDIEVVDELTGDCLCTAEAYWPTGLQEGIGRPVALELDEPGAIDALSSRGIEVFTSVAALREYVGRLGSGEPD
ncbi:GmrSD restriction endonuclease domain-containing protein [Nocardioides ultimimeridianus]